LIVLATLIAYYGIWDAGYIWDDEDYVTQNPLLRLPDGLWRIWFSPSELPQYYPLVHTTFWVEHQLWGLQAAGYHLVNVALHALNAVLFLGILRRLEVPGALFAALLFALHPVHVESVAWITERKNVLSGTFYLLSLGAWLRFSDSGERRAWAVSFVLFALALLSKTVTCSLPAVFLLIAWWRAPARSNAVQAAIAKLKPALPFFVIGFTAAMVTAALERGHVRAEGPEFAFSAAERLLIAGRALWFYAWNLLWPFGTCFNYPRWLLDASSPLQWAFPTAAVLLVIALARAIPKVGRTPLFVALCFGGSLVPALGFFNIYPMRYSFVADHFQYLANLAPLALIAAIGAEVLGRKAPAYTNIGRIAAGATAILLAVQTHRATAAYEDAETLWAETLEQNPDSWLARTNIAGHLIQSGDLDEAIANLERSLEIQRLSGHEAVETWMALGLAHWRRGSLDEARRAFESGRNADPAGNQNLAWLGGLLHEMGEFAAARVALEESIAVREDNWTAQAFLAELAFSTGDAQAAVRHAETALALNPLAYPALRARARALLALGRIEEAIPAAGTALLRDPSTEATRRMFVDVLAASLQSFEPERAAAVAEQVFGQVPADVAGELGTALLARLTEPARRIAVRAALEGR
jgi:tetratricopeptide (TPR) repeat protein